ncbi:MAG: hypothetical protein JGK17_10445 [Microcoleus sp. PH2017_10_PVI_O_A]|uniref:hypothetical protein n=1 Tax=unclassified Microcoleus TaxID=2642155 RepID=UPI001D2709DB|nr:MULTISPECIES: hypothetical protein [unclassified Microcoleus]MCC3405992.1 hypothetical protein [Microcoleus sp. PH2017_10_PVI_O_A]MCC3460021.1 hypothetical protein [Microcoleus sp. PH2017_11_PCY_U_A]MCC3478521.1 hypothetical protein [Microcoleus sp. PH2017_12_PCY_D_A]MCC3530184.1 hypothetical protein [Microcoleus sp. PH2017_21_RUC_O_A]MCC3542485.1 hypothetical protein [Microcoleus sp. PH2017_22_RUC_O_B]
MVFWLSILRLLASNPSQSVRTSGGADNYLADTDIIGLLDRKYNRSGDRICRDTDSSEFFHPYSGIFITDAIG